MNKSFTTILSLSLLTLFSCKKLENTINKTVGDNDEGTITAKIDGKTYEGANVSAGISTSGTAFYFSASDFGDDESMSININEYNTATKTYKFEGVFGKTTASYTNEGGNTYHAISGELTIESAGEHTAKGSFYFDTEEGLKVTDGKFDLNWK